MIFNKLFKRTDVGSDSYQEFWDWFQKNESQLHQCIKNARDIEKDFMAKVDPKLKKINEGFFILVGMSDTNTAELIISAEGAIKNFVFVEEFIDAAPSMPGWRFTALKPAISLEKIGINYNNLIFDSNTLNFYAIEHTDYPDLIDIVITHPDYSESNKEEVINGVYLFLDNYLGELTFANIIDNIAIINTQDAEQELVSLEKLKDFLNWRQKEFVEKYETIRYDSQNDDYGVFEGQMHNGLPIIATFNTSILWWSGKTYHPWILRLDIQYDGRKNNGLPDNETNTELDNLEKFVIAELKETDGFLHLGRETGDNLREMYFACNEFRKPSKVAAMVSNQFKNGIKVNYTIYKDRYWRSFDRFLPEV